MRERGRNKEASILQTWRWFGPDDPVSLENPAQAGAAGIVTALHRGEAWSEDEISQRRGEIERAGLVWSVVESIGVGEEIKTRSGEFRQKIDNYKQSIRNASRAGVQLAMTGVRRPRSSMFGWKPAAAPATTSRRRGKSDRRRGAEHHGYD
jgi:D-mannonate dehydratase UxuA-like protein